MTKLEKIMKDRDVKKATEIKIAETIIFPTVTYGSESWTVRKKERKKKIDAFELWTWRRILSSSLDREENLSVLEDVKPKRSLEATILLLTLRRLMSYIYIYGAPILDVSRSHTTTQHSR